MGRGLLRLAHYKLFFHCFTISNPPTLPTLAVLSRSAPDYREYLVVPDWEVLTWKCEQVS